MSQFLKMLLLVTTVYDQYSKWMLFWEWMNEDPVLELRFEMACRCGDLVG